MRVLINETQALKPTTGIGRYTAELLQGLRQHPEGPEVDVFPSGWPRRAVSFCLGSSGARSGGRMWSGVRGLAARHLRAAFLNFLERRFRAGCARRRYDLYHEPNLVPFPADCPTVATLHDLSLLLHPEWHPADRARGFARQLPRILAQCGHFITDSDAVRREVIRTLGVRPERVSRVYLGIRPEFHRRRDEAVAQRLSRLGLPPRYFLFVGTIEPRKNLLTLLQAYCALAASVRSCWPLVLAGSWGWGYGDTADYLHGTARHRGVIHVGHVADDDLPFLYSGARALLYPSHYEGFGLPPLEMLACGGAVVASTAAAHRETIGRQAHLVDADDLNGWRDAMDRVATDEEWWRLLRQGARAAARPFTWERCAAETIDVYRAVCGRSVALPDQKRSAA